MKIKIVGDQIMYGGDVVAVLVPCQSSIRDEFEKLLRANFDVVSLMQNASLDLEDHIKELRDDIDSMTRRLKELRDDIDSMMRRLTKLLPKEGEQR